MKKIFVFLMLGLIFSCTKSEDKKTVSKETVKDVPTIRLVMKDLNPSDEKSMKVIKSIEKGMAEQGNPVHIELVELPQGNYAEKLTLMIVGGDIPDLIYFQGGDKKIADQGVLEDLTPYIEKSSIIQSAMEPYNKARMKNYPYLIWLNPIVKKIPAIRKSWLDEYGKTPVTIEDYYDMFKYFHDKKGVYGLSATGDTARLDSVFNFAFGIKSTWIKAEDGSFVYSKTTEGEKNKLEFYKKLYAEGLLDPEYITTKWNTLEDKFYNQKTAVIIGSSGRVMDIYQEKLNENEPNEELVILQPPKGVDQGFVPVDTSKESRGMAISSQSKHKDLAFKILEYIASEKGQIEEQYGFEGEEYNIKDGKIVFTDKIKKWYPTFFEVTARKMEASSLGKAGLTSRKIADSFYNEDINFLIPEEFAAKWDAMENLYKEYEFKIISGEYELAKFDEFVQKWKEIGGTEILKYVNETLK